MLKELEEVEEEEEESEESPVWAKPRRWNLQLIEPEHAHKHQLAPSSEILARRSSGQHCFGRPEGAAGESGAQLCLCLRLPLAGRATCAAWRQMCSA